MAYTIVPTTLERRVFLSKFSVTCGDLPEIQDASLSNAAGKRSSRSATAALKTT
jgi:hypothetical protein